MKLISEFGSIEELFRNTEKIKGKCREIIENYKEQIEFSKVLARIDRNAPIELNEEYLSLRGPDIDKLKILFEELEFKATGLKILADSERKEKQEKIEKKLTIERQAGSLQGNLFDTGTESEPIEKISLTGIDHNYSIIDDLSELKSFAEELASSKDFVFNVETTGLNPMSSELVAISFCLQKGSGSMVTFPCSQEETNERLRVLKPVFENSSVRKTGYNMKPDIQVLERYGIQVKGPIFDILIAHYLIEPEMRHDIETLSELYLSYRTIVLESVFGEKGTNQRNMRLASVEKLKDFSVEGADITWQLKKIFEPELVLQNLDTLADNIEMPLIKVLATMERCGVKLDLNDLSTIMGDLRNDILQLEREIYDLAGTEFNISSPKQLGDILFIRLKLDEKARMTKTKQFITSEEILQRLVSKHPIVEKVLEYRGLKKLLTTYVEALPQLVDPGTGRIHTCFNQAVAATGRLSSNNPNLQNIPVRDERGRQIRKAFVAEKGYIFLSADYSQIELRLMAHLSKDKGLIEDFLSGNDIHAATAAKIFGVDIKDVTREMRSRAKTANFGIMYGISTFGLAERLTIGRKEAKDLIDGYFSSYPGIKIYMEESIEAARDLGYVKTMFGRRRYLKDIHSRNQVVRGMAERNAINAPIQGSAADIIKIAMVRIHDRLNTENFRSKMILQVHDELIFEVFEPEFDKLVEMAVFEMSNAVKLDVPLLVDWGRGQNWFEAH
jgi:DNA polymerase-1